MALYIPKEKNGKGWEAFRIMMEENQTQLDRIDAEAKAKGEILWRYITEPFADGEAIYQIIKVNKNTVRIRRCTGLGDDWQIPYWGDEASIDIDYAKQKIVWRDRINAFFAEERAESGGGKNGSNTAA